ncbi:carbohydrate sulfotransferase 1-like [Amphiura filiformis]|uniref:carbohydrate sulfotransferase 1-like n=1 Tax=Amphiura filiformis TaxID=82378 RepID=UPI003B20D234
MCEEQGSIVLRIHGMKMNVHIRSVIIILVAFTSSVLILLLFYPDSNVTNDFKDAPFYEEAFSIDYDNMSVSMTTDKPVRVIIVTQMRSGSSFTGELFNRNDDFVYYFEPLYEMRHKIQGKNANFDRFLRLPLLNLMKCDFRNMPINWWRPRSRIPRNDCRYSRAFQMSTSFCQLNRTIPSLRYNPVRHVPDNVTKLENMCNRKKYVAIKTIRVVNISYLRDVVEDPALDVRIIHLVRDPRAVFLSRKLVIGMMENPHKNISSSCPRLEQNIKYWLDTPDWLQKRYLLVRYEDLADRPLRIASDIYKFLGIQMSVSVKHWIKQNTDHNAGNSFSRTRNSHSTSVKWRTALNMNEVDNIQSTCHNVMRLLGYKEVTSHARLRNLNYPLMVPLSTNRTLRKPTQ